MNKPTIKNIKIAIITFVVLGFTGMAILKGKSMIKGVEKKKPKKTRIQKRRIGIRRCLNCPKI